MEQKVYDFSKISLKDFKNLNDVCKQLGIHENPNMSKINQLVDIEKPKENDKVRFVCISDTHCTETCFENVPDGDVLIHAGDFSYVGSKQEIKAFIEQFEKLPHKHKVVIAGNHDISLDFEKWKYHRDSLVSRFRQLKNIVEPNVEQKQELRDKFIYLEDESRVVEGYKIWGSPWSLYFFDWAFNLRMCDAEQKWNEIEDDSEIVITHGPALGFGDKVYDGNRVGCYQLLKRLKQIKPIVHICGHIHEDHGIWKDQDTIFINASTLDFRYNHTNRPIVFDLPVKKT